MVWRQGAFHRVFTIATKVVAYVNYLDMRAVESGLASLAREMAEEQRLGPATDRISPVRLVVEGLKLELRQHGEGSGLSDLFASVGGGLELRSSKSFPLARSFLARVVEATRALRKRPR